MRSLEKQFGPDALNYVSMDDKAKVPIGLAAAKVQTPLLMHLEYKVKMILFIQTNELTNTYLFASISLKNFPFHSYLSEYSESSTHLPIGF